MEGTPGPGALVTLGGERFYSNGYDLEWLRGQSREDQRAFVAQHQRLLARLVRLELPCVAAITGHAIGGGALLAMAHDLRVMREERGTFWLPEIDAGIPFRSGMVALLEAKLAPAVLRDVVLAGVRLCSSEACDARVVDALAPGDALVAQAVRRAAALAEKDRATYGRMKQRLWSGVANALEADGAAAAQSRGGP